MAKGKHGKQLRQTIGTHIAKVVGAITTHEAQVHTRQPCNCERIAAVAYLCCLLSVRGVALLDVTAEIANLDGATGPSPLPSITSRPRRVCLCGSTRFRDAYAKAFYDEEHAGRIALSVPCYKDDPCCKTAEDHARLDALHFHKIDLADEILVLNVGGYIGDSTRREIAYAKAHCKPIRYLEPIQGGA